MAKRHWVGDQPEKCDLCEKKMTEQGATWVDGRIAGRSTWANMCERCHSQYGAGIGLGLGQRYNVIDGNKVEG